MDKKHLTYIECDKNGYHYGEVLNMVCLQQGCLDRALCCNACVEEYHNNHLTKPLKLVIGEAREHALKIQPVSLNTDKVIELLDNEQNQILKKFGIFKEKLIETINTVEKTLKTFYSSTVEQVQVKTTSSKHSFDKLFDEIYEHKASDQLLRTLQRMMALIPKKDTPDESIKENVLVFAISSFSQDLNDRMSKATEEILQSASQLSSTLTQMVADKDIWAQHAFYFSNKFKNQGVQILSPCVAKSGSIQAYKFALLEPQLRQTSGIEKLAFKIKECTSNWLAFGVCHKNIVASKNYSFVFNSIGHGGYLISSNGGSWSHIKSEFNNAVKTFKFSKGDTIIMEVNWDTLRIKFRKKGFNDTYELEFTKVSGDPLYPCALLYYPNDEVMFLPDFKE